MLNDLLPPASRPVTPEMMSELVKLNLFILLLIPMSELAPGEYLLRLQCEDEIKEIRLINK